MHFVSKPVVASALALSACVALTSCSGGEEVAADIPSTANVAPDSETKSAESSVSESPSETAKPTASDRGFAGPADEATVLAFHKKLWEELTQNNASKEERRAYGRRYATDPGYNSFIGQIEFNKAARARLDGELKTDAAIEKMEGNVATVIDCQDVRKLRWEWMDTGTKEDYWGVNREARATYEHDGSAWFLTSVNYSPWDMNNRSKTFRCDELIEKLPTQW